MLKRGDVIFVAVDKQCGGAVLRHMGDGRRLPQEVAAANAIGHPLIATRFCIVLGEIERGPEALQRAEDAARLVEVEVE